MTNFIFYNKKYNKFFIFNNYILINLKYFDSSIEFENYLKTYMLDFSKNNKFLTYRMEFINHIYIIESFFMFSKNENLSLEEFTNKLNTINESARSRHVQVLKATLNEVVKHHNGNYDEALFDLIKTFNHCSRGEYFLDGTAQKRNILGKNGLIKDYKK